MTSPEETIRTELARVNSRLETTPVARIDHAFIEQVRAAAQRIVDLTPDPSRPTGSLLTEVGPTALAAQLTVIVRDYLDMRTAASDDAAVAETLIDLRRSLP